MVSRHTPKVAVQGAAMLTSAGAPDKPYMFAPLFFADFGPFSGQPAPFSAPEGAKDLKSGLSILIRRD